jgi:hypothetical protein
MYTEWRKTNLTEKLVLIRVLEAAGDSKSNSSQ